MPVVLYLLALAVFAMGTSEFMLAGLVPGVADDLDVPLGTAGLLTSAFALGMAVGAPLMAVVSRRWPVRHTLLGCLVMFAACHVVAALTPAFAPLLISRVVAAFANAGFLAVALGVAARLVPVDRKGRALGVLLSGTTIAMVVGVPAGALVGTVLDWRATFWAVAVLCVPATVGVVRGVPQRLDDDVRTVSVRSEFGVLRRPALVAAVLLAVLVNGGTFAAFTYVAPLVVDEAGLRELWVPVALMLFGIGSFMGVTVAGRLSDRHPRGLLLVATPALLVGWVLTAQLAAQPGVLLALVLVQGLLGFAVGSTAITRVLHVASDAPSMGGSYATAALNVGAVLGPVGGGAALTVAGPVGPVWVAVALGVAALVVVLLASRTALTR